MTKGTKAFTCFYTMLLLLKISIAALIFAIGMSATRRDITYLWHKPILLLKSIVAMYLVMPVTAVLILLIFDLPSSTELALVILSICAGAPLLPKKLIKIGGDPTYVFSLIVTTSLIAIVSVPASLHFLSTIISLDTTAVTPAPVALLILKTFLLPLGLGMLLRRLFSNRVDRIVDPLLKVSGIAMALCAIAILATGFHLVFDVGLPSLLAFALFTLIALGTGHLFGSPDPSTQSSLAIACSSRHIGLALLIAANAHRQQHALALVIGYLLMSAIVSSLYILMITSKK
ncbi:MAG: hypothetical protein ABFR31_07465 [Thermodesulfobacteriota bacterium]